MNKHHRATIPTSGRAKAPWHDDIPKRNLSDLWAEHEQEQENVAAMDEWQMELEAA